MNAREALLTRRSVRQFSGRPLSSPTVSRIVEAGLTAPSSKNAQPWGYHVVKRRKINSLIATFVEYSPASEDYAPVEPITGRPNPDYKSSVKESAHILGSAAAAIYVENRSPFLGGRKNVVETNNYLQAVTTYGIECLGLGASIQNILLAAHSEGVGAVFMGDITIEEANIQKLLDFKGDLMGAIALGYPVSNERFPKTIETDRVTWH